MYEIVFSFDMLSVSSSGKAGRQGSIPFSMHEIVVDPVLTLPKS
jgi:hypothetical protein